MKERFNLVVYWLALTTAIARANKRPSFILNNLSSSRIGASRIVTDKI